MEDGTGAKAPVTRLQRRLSTEVEDVSSPQAPSTPKKKPARLAAKPLLENIDENAPIQSPRKARGIASTAEPQERVLTPSRRSVRIKSHPSSCLCSDTCQTFESPRAMRALRRNSNVGSDTETQLTPVKQTRRSIKNTDAIEVEKKLVVQLTRETIIFPEKQNSTEKSPSLQITPQKTPQNIKSQNVPDKIVVELQPQKLNCTPIIEKIADGVPKSAIQLTKEVIIFAEDLESQKSKTNRKSKEFEITPPPVAGKTNIAKILEELKLRKPQAKGKSPKLLKTPQKVTENIASQKSPQNVTHKEELEKSTPVDRNLDLVTKPAIQSTKDTMADNTELLAQDGNKQCKDLQNPPENVPDNAETQKTSQNLPEKNELQNSNTISNNPEVKSPIIQVDRETTKLFPQKSVDSPVDPRKETEITKSQSTLQHQPDKIDSKKSDFSAEKFFAELAAETALQLSKQTIIIAQKPELKIPQNQDLYIPQKLPDKSELQRTNDLEETDIQINPQKHYENCKVFYDSSLLKVLETSQIIVVEQDHKRNEPNPLQNEPPNPLHSESPNPLRNEAVNSLQNESSNPLQSESPNPLKSESPNPLLNGPVNYLHNESPNPLQNIHKNLIQTNDQIQSISKNSQKKINSPKIKKPSRDPPIKNTKQKVSNKKVSNKKNKRKSYKPQKLPTKKTPASRKIIYHYSEAEAQKTCTNKLLDDSVANSSNETLSTNNRRKSSRKSNAVKILQISFNLYKKKKPTVRKKQPRRNRRKKPHRALRRYKFLSGSELLPITLKSIKFPTIRALRRLERILPKHWGSRIPFYPEKVIKTYPVKRKVKESLDGQMHLKTMVLDNDTWLSSKYLENSFDTGVKCEEKDMYSDFTLNGVKFEEKDIYSVFTLPDVKFEEKDIYSGFTLTDVKYEEEDIYSDFTLPTDSKQSIVVYIPENQSNIDKLHSRNINVKEESGDQCVPVVNQDLNILEMPVMIANEANILVPINYDALSKPKEKTISLCSQKSVEPMEIDESIPENISITDFSKENLSKGTEYEATNRSKLEDVCQNLLKNRDKTCDENKSTLILSIVNDESASSSNLTKSPKAPFKESFENLSNVSDLSKSMTSKKINISHVTKSKVTPLKHKNSQLLFMQTSTPVTSTNDESNVEKSNTSMNTSTKKLSETSNKSEKSDLCSSDESSDGENISRLIINEAEDAGEDYESGDSRSESEKHYERDNEIKEKGETLDSDSLEEDQDDSEDEDYENDSFIVTSDEEDDELLSGTGDDLSMSDNELTMTARSKKKFNDRKVKEQKKASREMYAARHGNKVTSNDSSDLNSSRPQLRNNEDDIDNVIKPTKKNKMRLESHSDADTSITDKKNVSKPLLETSSFPNENEITAIVDESVIQKDDPLKTAIKTEPKTPQKGFDISTVNISVRQDVEEVQVNEDVSMINANETSDPLQATMAFDYDDASSSGESQQIMQNYDSVLSNLNKENNKKRVGNHDSSLNLNKKTKSKKNISLLDKLNLTDSKNRKKRNQSITDDTEDKNKLSNKREEISTDDTSSSDSSEDLAVDNINTKKKQINYRDTSVNLNKKSKIKPIKDQLNLAATKQPKTIKTVRDQSKSSKSTGQVEADTMEDTSSDSLDLKLLLPDDMSDTSGNNRNTDSRKSVDDDFIPLKRTDAKHNLHEKNENKCDESLIKSPGSNKKKSKKSSISLEENQSEELVEVYEIITTVNDKKKKNKSMSESSAVTDSEQTGEHSLIQINQATPETTGSSKKKKKKRLSETQNVDEANDATETTADASNVSSGGITKKTRKESFTATDPNKAELAEKELNDGKKNKQTKKKSEELFTFADTMDINLDISVGKTKKKKVKDTVTMDSKETEITESGRKKKSKATEFLTVTDSTEAETTEHEITSSSGKKKKKKKTLTYESEATGNVSNISVTSGENMKRKVSVAVIDSTEIDEVIHNEANEPSGSSKKKKKTKKLSESHHGTIEADSNIAPEESEGAMSLDIKDKKNRKHSESLTFPEDMVVPDEVIHNETNGSSGSSKKKKKNKKPSESHHGTIDTDYNIAPEESEGAMSLDIKSKKNRKHSESFTFPEDMVVPDEVIHNEANEPSGSSKKKKKNNKLSESHHGTIEADSNIAPEESEGAMSLDIKDKKNRKHSESLTFPEEMMVPDEVIHNETNGSSGSSKKKKKNKKPSESHHGTIDTDYNIVPEDSEGAMSLDIKSKKNRKHSESFTFPEDMVVPDEVIHNETNGSSGSSKKKKKNKKPSESHHGTIETDYNIVPEESEGAMSLDIKNKKRKHSESFTFPEDNNMVVPDDDAPEEVSSKKRKRTSSVTAETQKDDILVNPSTTAEKGSLLAAGSQSKKLKLSSDKETESKISEQIEKPPKTGEVPKEGALEKKKKKKSKVVAEADDLKSGSVASSHRATDTDQDAAVSSKNIKKTHLENVKKECPNPNIPEKKNKKRKEREDDERPTHSKVLKENFFDNIQIARLPNTLLKQLDQPKSKSRSDKIVATSAFIVEETVKRKNKPSNYVEESVYLNDDLTEKKKYKLSEKPKLLPFVPTASSSGHGFTTNFQVNVCPKEVKFTAQPSGTVNFKNDCIQSKKMKKLGTHEMYKSQRKVKLSKF